MLQGTPYSPPFCLSSDQPTAAIRLQNDCTTPRFTNQESIERRFTSYLSLKPQCKQNADHQHFVPTDCWTGKGNERKGEVSFRFQMRKTASQCLKESPGCSVVQNVHEIRRECEDLVFHQGRTFQLLYYSEWRSKRAGLRLGSEVVFGLRCQSPESTVRSADTGASAGTLRCPLF